MLMGKVLYCTRASVTYCHVLVREELVLNGERGSKWFASLALVMDENTACGSTETVRVDWRDVLFFNVSVFISFSFVSSTAQLAKRPIARIDVDLIMLGLHEITKLHTHLPESNVALLPLRFAA